MTNYYPEKPFIPYVRTTAEMADVIAKLKAIDTDVEVKRTAYIIFRNESANGHSGICNNYSGFQADSGRWDAKYDSLIYGVVKKVEAGTGKERLFLAFNDVGGCLAMLTSKIKDHGLYVGGSTHLIWEQYINNAQTLARAYKKQWAAGSAKAEPSLEELNSFLSMYRQAAALFV
jgi:hypothetical protein